MNVQPFLMMLTMIFFFIFTRSRLLSYYPATDTLLTSFRFFINRKMFASVVSDDFFITNSSTQKNYKKKLTEKQMVKGKC